MYRLIQRLKASNGSAALERLREKLLRGPDDPSMRKHKRRKHHDSEYDGRGYGGRNLLAIDGSYDGFRAPEVASEREEGTLREEVECGHGECERSAEVDPAVEANMRDADAMWWAAIAKEARQLMTVSGILDVESDTQRWSGRRHSVRRMLLNDDDGEGQEGKRKDSKASGHGEFYAFPKECLCDI